jgi:hypothetical protein
MPGAMPFAFAPVSVVDRLAQLDGATKGVELRGVAARGIFERSRAEAAIVSAFPDALAAPALLPCRPAAMVLSRDTSGGAVSPSFGRPSHGIPDSVFQVQEL